MALFAVYCKSDKFQFAGEPIYSTCIITQSETEAIAKTRELVEAGLDAFYEQIQ